MTMALDIATPKGQETLKQEDRAVELFEARFPNLVLLSTPKEKPADVDRMMYRRAGATLGSLAGVVEVKCRATFGNGVPATFEAFRSRAHSRWLITEAKIEKGRKLGRALQVPFFGVLYLVPDDLLLVQRIYHADGSAATDIDFRKGETQATVNGGRATRVNAYVLVKDEGWKLPDAPPVIEEPAATDPALDAVTRAQGQTVAEWVRDYEGASSAEHRSS